MGEAGRGGEVIETLDARECPFPESGWPPLMKWCRAHGLDPDRTQRLEWAEGVCRATVFVLDEEGHPLVEDDSVQCETVVVRYIEPPPRIGT